MKRKYLLVFTLTLTLALITACSKKEQKDFSEKITEENTEALKEEKKSVTEETTSDKGVIKVAIVGEPQNEILQHAAVIMQRDGWDLQVKEYDDFTAVNEAVEKGECDANYCEHPEFLKIYNEKNRKNLVSVMSVHYEPLGVYAGTENNFNAISNGAKIAIPKDTIRRVRTLLFLQDRRLITLRDDVGITAVVDDIVENPKNLQLIEMDCADIPGALKEDVAFGIMDGNYALAAGFVPTRDALLTEKTTSSAAKTFGIQLVVQEGNEGAAGVKALVKTLQSKELKDFIMDYYQGAVVPF